MMVFMTIEFQNVVQFMDGGYEVWKDSYPVLPDNHQLAVRRLRGLLCHLRQEPQILQEYNSTIQDQIRQGIVEVIKEPQRLVTGSEVHYLPCHTVIRRDKHTTRLRIVYDPSTKSEALR